MIMEWSDWEGAGGEDERGGEGEGGGGGGGEARERHKLAERERRKSMRELFLCLHSHLPHAQTVRKEQSAILDEIIKYIPLAAARLRTLQNKRDQLGRSSSSPQSLIRHPIHVADRDNASALDFDIRVMPDSASSVAVRMRGNRVNVSLTDTRGAGQTMLLSTILDELEAHHLELLRSTHCRDGSKLLHHSECKVVDGLEISPALLKSRLQDLACKLHRLRRSSVLKRSFHQLD